MDTATLNASGGSYEACCNRVYTKKLGALCSMADDLAGESRYQPLMEGAYARLEADGLLREDDGSMIVDVPGFENRDGEPLPFIV